MKKHFTLFTILALFFAMNAAATVWRVNNNYGVDADFSNLQTAINDENVQPFDTLYVEGSNTSYGDIDIDKPLALLGTGYFLNENDTSQAIKFPSKISTVDFMSGSSGSILTGFSFLEYESTFIKIYTNNIIFSRNCIKISGSFSGILHGIYIQNYAGLTNIVIENNYIDMKNANGNPCYVIYSTTSGLGLSIKNNFLSAIGGNNGRSIYLTGNYCTYSIHNNVLKGDLNTKNGAYVNNILLDGTVSGTNNFYFYNLCNDTQFGNGNGNQQNVDMNTVFVDHTSGVDNGLILSPGSPAIGAGFEGGDCGVFGGENPYVLSGMPPIPSIFEITHSGIGSVNTPIEVNLKAKSNR